MTETNTHTDDLQPDPGVSDADRINPGHEKTRRKLRRAGIICIIVAVPLMCIPFVGFPLLFAGLVMTMFGYAGKMARYQAAEMAPVQKDAFNYLAEGTQDGVHTAARAVGGGFAEGMAAGSFCPSADASEPGVRCHKCNYVETADAKFCSKCGTALQKSKACPACNELNDPDAKFCDNCGKQL